MSADSTPDLSECSDAIKLARSSRWDALCDLVEAKPESAQHVDSYGMLPLHWACTEPHSFQEGILMTLLKAYPHGAKHKNTAGMVPLQIAIKAQANIEWLQALLASYPQAVLKKVPSGENAVQLARKCHLEGRSIKLLEEMYLHVCEMEGIDTNQHQTDAFRTRVGGEDAEWSNERKPKVISIASMSDVRAINPHSLSESAYQSRSGDSKVYGGVTGNHSDVGIHTDKGNGFANSMYGYPQGYKSQSGLATRAIVSLPPRWTNSPNCQICTQKFGPFKKRHHCRNCGQSICSDHSAREKMRLPHYGLYDRHRVCIVCHDTLRDISRQSLQPRRSRLVSAGSVGAVLGIPPRRSDEITRESSQYYHQLRLERHVSAPAVSNANQSSDNENIHRQVEDLQKQVTKLMREKELAESQLRIQTGLLLEAERLTNSSRASSNGVKRSSGTSQEGQLYNDQSSLISAHTNTEECSRSNLAEDFNKHGSADERAPSTVISEPVSSPRPGASDSEDQEISNINNVDEDGAVHDSSCSIDKSEDDTLLDDEDEEDSSSPEVQVLVSLGQSLLDKGSANAAVQAFSRAVELCASDAALYTSLGKAQYADNDIDEAIKSITKSIELEVSATNLTLLGKIYFEKGDHEKAIEAYQKSLAIQQPSE